MSFSWRRLGRQAPVLLVSLVLAVVYGTVLARILGPDDFNPLAAARISAYFPAERFWDHDPVFVDLYGYDGQFVYYIARDPLLSTPPLTYLDHPAYRYQRILLPVLGHLLALGQPSLMGWSLLLVNVGALAFGTWCASRILDHFGRSQYWLLAYALNPGFVFGIPLDLLEPLALAFTTAAVLAVLKDRRLVAAGMLAIGLLARETIVTVAVGLALCELFRNRSFRRALPYGLPVAVFLMWQMVVRWRTGEWAFVNGAGHLASGAHPLAGPFERLVAVITGQGLRMDYGSGTRVIEVLVVAALVLAAVAAVAAIRRPGPLSWQLAFQGFFVLALNQRVWDETFAYARVAFLLYFFYMVGVMEERHRVKIAAQQPASVAAPHSPGLSHLTGEPRSA